MENKNDNINLDDRFKRKFWHLQFCDFSVLDILTNVIWFQSLDLPTERLFVSNFLYDISLALLKKCDPQVDD